MNFNEVTDNARGRIGNYCKACYVCNGKACKNQVPGPGAKGSGTGAIENFEAWKKIKVNMDTISDVKNPDTGIELFGKHFDIPVFAGPVGAVNLHYGDCYDDNAYNDILVRGCAEAGIAAFTGDGVNEKVMQYACDAIKKNDGSGVPTVKPWGKDIVDGKIELVKESGSFAMAMDIDAAGLPFLKNCNPPAGSKSVEELADIAKNAGKPFIVKGIISVKGALKAKEAGAAGIVVSNHGGRVLEQCPASADVLAEIADALKGSGMKIIVDGGIRDGVTVFKALAMGADAVIIARPFVTAVYGGEEEGIKCLVEKLKGELADTMSMCGAQTIADIDRTMVRF